MNRERIKLYEKDKKDKIGEILYNRKIMLAREKKEMLLKVNLLNITINKNSFINK